MSLRFCFVTVMRITKRNLLSTLYDDGQPHLAKKERLSSDRQTGLDVHLRGLALALPDSPEHDHEAEDGDHDAPPPFSGAGGMVPRHQAKGEQAHHVHDLDERVDGRASRVLQWISHGVSRDRRFVRIGTLATIDAIFDQLLSVVPCTAGVGHENREELTHDDHARQKAAQCVRAEQEADDHGCQDREDPGADQLLLGGQGTDVHDTTVVGLLGSCPDLGVLELGTALPNDVERGPSHSPNEHGAEKERYRAADEETHQDHRVRERQLGRLGHVLADGHEPDIVLAPDREDRDEAGEQRHGRDDGRANGNALGLGLGRVADSIEVGQDLPGPLVAALLGPLHLGRIEAHLADAVGIVGDRAEDIHRNRVAGQSEHADASHRDAVGDEEGRCARVAEDGGQHGRDNNQERRDGTLVADREPLDDVGGVPGLARPGHALDRLVLGVGVVARHLVECDSQEHTYEASQHGPQI